MILGGTKSTINLFICSTIGGQIVFFGQGGADPSDFLCRYFFLFHGLIQILFSIHGVSMVICNLW